MCKGKGYESKWCVFRKVLLIQCGWTMGCMGGYEAKNVGWYKFRKGLILHFNDVNFNHGHEGRQMFLSKGMT